MMTTKTRTATATTFPMTDSEEMGEMKFPEDLEAEAEPTRKAETTSRNGPARKAMKHECNDA